MPEAYEAAFGASFKSPTPALSTSRHRNVGFPVAQRPVMSEDRSVQWRLFEGIPDEEVRELLKLARRRTFRRGEVVVHQNDPADSLIRTGPPEG